MHPDFPEPEPFVITPDRERVTGQPPRSEEERWEQQHYMALEKMGGGHVPESYEWTSSPKEHQDEVGITEIAGATSILRQEKRRQIIEQAMAGELPTV